MNSSPQGRPNRRTRRLKLPTDVKYTKSTHSMKKARAKNAKRRKAAVKARKKD